MEKKKETTKEFLENKVKRIMAGYKANYNKSINQARAESERQALMSARDKWIAKKREEVIVSIQGDLMAAVCYLEQCK